MANFVEGDVVIIDSGQAGTLVQLSSRDIWVLLANGNIFTGLTHQIRYPQDKTDLDACPLNVERLEQKRTVRND